jgi:protein-arginine kinase activator protein McsA
MDKKKILQILSIVLDNDDGEKRKKDLGAKQVTCPNCQHIFEVPEDTQPERPIVDFGGGEEGEE